MTRKAIGLFASAVFAVHATSAAATDLPELLAKAKQSTVYLWIPAEDPRTGARRDKSASGFIVSKTGRIVTAAHVLKEWKAQGDAQKAKNKIIARIGSIYADPVLDLAFIEDDRRADIAILGIRREGEYMAVTLCGVGTKPAGEQITVIGFPLGQEFNHSQGTIANSDAPGLRWTTNTSMDEGMSGGPVFVAQGRVVGIVQGGLELEVGGVERPSATIRYVTPLVRASSYLLNNEVILEKCAEQDLKKTGISSQDVTDLVRQQKKQEPDAASQQKIAELSKELGLTREALTDFFKRLGEDTSSSVDPVKRLAELAEQYREARDRAGMLRGDDPKVKALVGEAHDAINNGDYSKADGLLANAEEAELAGIRQLEAAREKRLLNAAAERADRGHVARLRANFEEAAGHFRAARERVPEIHADVREEYQRFEADALYLYGNVTGDKDALRRVIAIRKELLQTTRAARERVALEDELGKALRFLGGEEESIDLLKQAVAAHRAALNALPASAAPKWRAELQDNLALALRWLGQREKGADSLKEAVTTYRSVLEVFTHELEPGRWADIQNNMCFALADLGRRTKSKERLAEGVAACRSASELAKRDQNAVTWARYRNGLGYALLASAEQEKGMEKLEEAVTAFKDSIQIFEARGLTRREAAVRKTLADAEHLIAQRTTAAVPPTKKKE